MGVATLNEAPDEWKLDLSGKKVYPGPRKAKRMSVHAAAYCYVDPDSLARSPSPPIGVETGLEEVFGPRLKDDDGGVRIKIRLHPHLRRWAAYERVRKKDKVYWKVFSIFMEEPIHGKLPTDYDNLDSNDRQWLEHFRGHVGEFRVPTKRDFEILEKFDTRRHSAGEICDLLTKAEDDEKKESDRVMDDMTRAFHDYYANMAINEANQRSGSGQRMQSYATVPVKEQGYVTIEKSGYSVKYKPGSRFEERPTLHVVEREKVLV